jgi:hypothetical protein
MSSTSAILVDIKVAKKQIAENFIIFMFLYSHLFVGLL